MEKRTKLSLNFESSSDSSSEEDELIMGLSIQAVRLVKNYMDTINRYSDVKFKSFSVKWIYVCTSSALISIYNVYIFYFFNRISMHCASLSDASSVIASFPKSQ